MPNCLYCDVPIDETYNFCVGCEQQVKCLACHSYLIKDKSRCLKCGTFLSVSQAVATPMNSFSLEEEQTDSNYSRKLNLSFTDTAIDKVASVLGGYVPLAPSPRTAPVMQPQQQLALPFPKTSSANEHLDQAGVLDSTAIDTVATSASYNNDILDYFEKDGNGFLISRVRDYKGKNKKIQQQRFSTLYVWAYNSFNNEPVLNEHLTQAAHLNGIYDKNFPTYIKELAGRFFAKIDGSFKLNPAGSAALVDIQAEIKDSDLSGFEYWK